MRSHLSISAKILLLLLLVWSAGCLNKKDSKQVIEEPDWWLWAVDWHPNDDWLAVGGTQDTLRIFSVSQNKLVKNYPLPVTITKVKWHPTQDKLAIATQGQKARSYIFDSNSNERIELDSVYEFGARAIGWNRTGDLLAVGDYDGFLLIFDQEGNLMKKIDSGQKSLIGLDWHPTKNLIAAVGEKVLLYDMDEDTLKNIEDRGEEILMLCVAWHPSGEFFTTGDYGDYDVPHPVQLQYWTVEGEKIRSIEESKAEYRNMVWSKDGQVLATASEKVRLWDDQGNIVAQGPVENLLWGIDWNSDGTRLVTTDEEGKLVIWDQDLEQSTELAY